MYYIWTASAVVGGAAREMHRLLEQLLGILSRVQTRSSFSLSHSRLRARIAAANQNLVKLCRNRNGNVCRYGNPRDDKTENGYVSLTLWRRKLLFFIFPPFDF
jgi:hypothetical protein